MGILKRLKEGISMLIFKKIKIRHNGNVVTLKHFLGIPLCAYYRDSLKKKHYICLQTLTPPPR